VPTGAFRTLVFFAPVRFGMVSGKLHLPLHRRGVIIATSPLGDSMRKKSLKKSLCLSLGFSALLLSACGQAITRTKAGQLLGEIVQKVSSADFSLPTAWSVERIFTGTIAFGNQIYVGSANESYNFSKTEHYFHSTLAVNGVLDSSASATFQSEEWAYTDTKNLDGAKIYFLIHAKDDGVGNKVYSLASYKTLDAAAEAFSEVDSVKTEMGRTDDLKDVPANLQKTLASFSGSEVKSETYSTTGEYSFQSNLTYVSSGTEIHSEIVIKETMLTSVIESTSSLAGHVSYSWGRYKSSKPELSTFQQEEEE
jgi:hypothetical protein